MQYTTEQLEQMVLKVLEENHKIVFFDYIAPFIPVDRSTLYNHGINKLDSIKNKLEYNKILAKQKDIDQWGESDNPTLRIARFKLMASEEEYNRLATIKQDIKTNDKPIIIFRNASAEDKEESDIKADDGGD